jgi:hypothetical protein
MSVLIFFPLIFSLAQNVYACTWKVEVLDFLTKEVKQFQPEEHSSLPIDLKRPQDGISVLCIITKYKPDMLDPIRKRSSIDAACGFPDGQIVYATAATLLNTTTNVYEFYLPINLRFQNIKQPKINMGFSMKVECKP